MAKWRFQLADFDGTSQGEVYNVGDRVISFGLNKPDSLAFTLTRDNPATEGLIAKPEGLVRVYRNDELVLVTNIVSVQLSRGDTASIAVTCQETFWYNLSRRLIGKNEGGIELDPIDKAQAAVWLVSHANTNFFTGINAGTHETTTTVSNEDNPWSFKPYTEVLLELSQTLNGFEWGIEPKNEPYDHSPYLGFGQLNGTINAGPFIEWYTPKTSLSACERPNAIFEFGAGTRVNLTGYDLMLSNEHILTRGWHYTNDDWAGKVVFPSVGGSETGAAAARDVINLRGLYETNLENDLEDADLRRALAHEHVQIRSAPRQILNITLLPTVAGRTPEFLEEFFVGSVIPVRIKDKGLLTLNALMRVYGVEVSVSDVGQEQINLTVVDEAP